MTILWSNNASTTVSGSITSGSTSVQLAAGTGALFPNPTGGNYYVATFYDQATKTQNEIVHVTAMAGDVATIVRAQEGTTAKAWNAGDIFANLVTAGTLNAFVQAGTGPADTSLIYYGADTSATPNLIVANTNPVPAAIVTGMVFEIKVLNTNTSAVNIQLNGGTSIRATRTDGSDLRGGTLIAGQNYFFLYNGTTLNSTIMPVPVQPPQTTFYVRADSTSTVNSSGIESNSGYANTPSQAFKTIQGAINTIKYNYISQNTVTIRVADGTFTTGATDSTNYIATWNIIGNQANPAGCIVDCRSTNAASYVPGGSAGTCFATDGAAVMYVTGFTMYSYYDNVGTTGGYMQLIDNHYTNPVVGDAVIACLGGVVAYNGTANQYQASAPTQCFFVAASGGAIGMGGHDVYGVDNVATQIIGTPTFTRAFTQASAAGTVTIFSSTVTWNGPVSASTQQFYCDSGGGVWFVDGGLTGFPGTGYTVTPPGWAT